jgi:hypothetical protein
MDTLEYRLHKEERTPSGGGAPVPVQVERDGPGNAGHGPGEDLDVVEGRTPARVQDERAVDRRGSDEAATPTWSPMSPAAQTVSTVGAHGRAAVIDGFLTQAVVARLAALDLV